MNGAIIPHTPIAVDFWNARETAAKNCRLFFLSHAHADHTVGLSSSWKKHKIYCSELTKKIILHKFGICEDLVVGLPVDQPVVIAMDEVGKENLTVTLSDANHCPGAVLFLFQGYFGNILYTGDFRYHCSLSTHRALQNIVIDKLYLDNTYCDPRCVFPTREEATDMILDVVRRHLDSNIVFGMNTLGKEDLMAKIGVTFQKWIGVNPKRMELLKLLDLPDVFTCDIDSVSIRIVMRNQISKKNLQLWNCQHPSIAILPTALFEGETNIYKNMDNVFVIPYSDHSSFSELKAFVSEIRPKEIVPLVLRHRGGKGDPSNIRVNMTIFNSLLNKEPLSTFTIPETVLQFMGARTTVTKLKRRKSLAAPKQKRRKCTGVVFSDEEDEGDVPHERSYDGQFDKPENRTDCNGQTPSSLQPVNQALNKGLANIPEGVIIKEEIDLQDYCLLEEEDTNAERDSSTKVSASEQVVNNARMTVAVKKEKDIKAEEVEENITLQDAFSMEEMNVCTCTCKRENDILPRIYNLKQEEDSTDDHERKILLPHQEKEESENEMIKGLSRNVQTGSNFTVSQTSELTIKEAETMINDPEEDSKLAQQILGAFNSGQYDDEYTVANPVYKRFVGHFCGYLKTLTSETMLEAENNDDGKCSLSCTLRKNSVLAVEEDDDDSEDESEFGFNWFSSE